MRPVFQKELSTGRGDCFRACLATIFGLNINTMPNFWEKTQDSHKFWELVNEWSTKHLRVKLITTTLGDGHDYLIKDLLCIAIGRTDSEEEHCVVWRNKKLHDPYPNGDRSFHPESFTLIVPLTMEPPSEEKEK
jgi:hypothetical protein